MPNKKNVYKSRFAIGEKVFFSAGNSNREGVVTAVHFTESKVGYSISSKKREYTVLSDDVREAE